MSNATYDLLSSLLPTTPFALAYVLPLLFLSLLLTFAGTFLTLDRTRVFPPADPQKQVASTNKFPWLSTTTWSLFLEGGIGGLCSGFAFGVHLATFLSLLIPSETTSSPLGPKAFLAIWVLSALPCALLSGRWKYATLALAAASGYAALGVAFVVIAHPSLVTRIAIIPIFMVIGMVLSLLPFVVVRDIALRVANASAGSFGLVLCTAILARNAAWGNVWERLWVSNGAEWGTSKEKGLSAAYCLLFCVGIACDWLLHAKLGENPDEKWDRYLAKYTDNLPNDGSRAGTFTPFTSLYDRLLGRDRYFAPIVPDQTVPVESLAVAPEKGRDLEEPFEVYVPLSSTKPSPGFLRKKATDRPRNVRTARRAIKFQPDDDLSASSEDDESSPIDKPFVPRSLSSASSATLTVSRTSFTPPKFPIADVPEYSDYEEDLTDAPRHKLPRDDPAWTPEFIRRHSQRSSATRTNSRPTSPPSSRPAAEPLPGADPLSSVPATPSLIRAVDRINAAYTAQGGPTVVHDSHAAAPDSGLPSGRPWDSFWADVRAKAQT